MDLITKILLENCYKFEKGYPDLTNINDLNIIEEIFHKFDYEYIMNKPLLIKEGTTKKLTSNFIDNFISISKEKGYNFKKQTDWKRLGNTDKIPGSEFEKLLKDLFNITNIKIIPPKQNGNPSSKYNLYIFDYNGDEINIILSGGSNEGEKYEQNFVERLKQSTNISIDDIEYPDIKTLYNKLNINPEKLNSNDIVFEGGIDTKRNPDLKTIQNIGKTISDITINYNNIPYYISLKSKSGSGLYSGKKVPFIVFNGEQIIFDKSKYNEIETIKNSFELFNINPEKVAQGLNDYINKEQTITDITENISINDKMYNLFLSIIGKGYYYVKQYNNDVKVIPLLTDEDCKNFFGKINNVVLKYPNIKSKSTVVQLSVDSPTFGPNKYECNFRNTQGGILPLVMMIRKV